MTPCGFLAWNRTLLSLFVVPVISYDDGSEQATFAFHERCLMLPTMAVGHTHVVKDD